MSWWFRDIFREMERMMRETEEMMRKMFESSEMWDKELDIEGKPIVYGFSATIGPDGIPRIQTFGNVDSVEGKLLEGGWREPYTEIMFDKEKNVIRVIAEMPGITKKDIKVKAKDRYLKIEGESSTRKYRKTIDLKTEIDPKNIKAKFNNGILEIEVKPKQKLTKDEYDIEIE